MITNLLSYIFSPQFCCSGPALSAKELGLSCNHVFIAVLWTTNDDGLYTFPNYLEQYTSLSLHFTKVLLCEKVQEIMQNDTSAHILHSGLHVCICTFHTKDQLEEEKHKVPFLSDHLTRTLQMVIFWVSNPLRHHWVENQICPSLITRFVSI